MPFAVKKARREISRQSATDKIGVHAGMTRIRVFDRERRLNPESVHVHIPFVKPNPIFNPQPITPILIDHVHRQEKSARLGIVNLLTSQQAKAGEKTKSTIALTKVRPGILGRVAFHTPSFRLPLKADEVQSSTKSSLLDQVFDLINSIGKKK